MSPPVLYQRYGLDISFSRRYSAFLAGGEGEEPQKELGWKKTACICLQKKLESCIFDYLLEYKLEEVKLSQMFVKLSQRQESFSLIVSLKKEISGKCKKKRELRVEHGSNKRYLPSGRLALLESVTIG
jgi:hypothetical protein